MEDSFKQKLNNYYVDYQKAEYYNSAVEQWLSIWNEMISIFTTSVVLAISFAGRTFIPSGILVLCITYTLNAAKFFNYMIRHYTELESNMNAVERLVNFSKVEKEDIEGSVELEDRWVKEGEVEFKDVCLKYRSDLPLVLNKISFKIKPREKIGIVGRTGAGKSSLIAALFKLTPIESGSILVDNVDINDVGVRKLRSQFSIIPQDPVIFLGTLRFNLDPDEKFEDNELWRILELVRLYDYAFSLPDQLYTEMVEGGTNMSTGQRQLLCIARALLRGSKVLFLDEATAAIDPETDSILQETIKREFKDCTVMTIAHRLQTVLDYDKILVLSEGEVAEFDSPKNLLSNKESFFYKMVSSL